MIKHKDMVYIYIIMVQNMMGIGIKIINMVMVSRPGQMVVNIKVVIYKVRNMVKEDIYGKMGVIMMVIGIKIR